MAIGSAMASFVWVEPIPKFEPSSAGDAVVVVVVVEDNVDEVLVIVVCSCVEVVVVFAHGSGPFQVLLVSSAVDVEVIVSDVLVLVEFLVSAFARASPASDGSVVVVGVVEVDASGFCPFRPKA